MEVRPSSGCLLPGRLPSPRVSLFVFFLPALPMLLSFSGNSLETGAGPGASSLESGSPFFARWLYPVSLFSWSKERILWGTLLSGECVLSVPMQSPQNCRPREEPVGLSRGASAVTQQPQSRSDHTHHRAGPFLFLKTRCFLPWIPTRTLTVAWEFQNPEPPVLSGALP